MTDLTLESAYKGPVCGIDEAGRGPLAGPVVAACVYIPEDVRRHDFWRKVTDSKKTSAALRTELYNEITRHSFYGIAEASPAEIDRLNIHHATLLAMSRAYDAMCGNHPDCVAVMALIDGKFSPKLACPAKAIVGGDGLSLSIAAASILAKVTRDRLMQSLHEDHPHYGWNTNAGYPTAAHLAGLKTHGVTPHHRRSYAPVQEIISGIAA